MCGQSSKGYLESIQPGLRSFVHLYLARISGCHWKASRANFHLVRKNSSEWNQQRAKPTTSLRCKVDTEAHGPLFIDRELSQTLPTCTHECKTRFFGRLETDPVFETYTSDGLEGCAADVDSLPCFAEGRRAFDDDGMEAGAGEEESED